MDYMQARKQFEDATGYAGVGEMLSTAGEWVYIFQSENEVTE